jgi:hypothetical protein
VGVNIYKKGHKDKLGRVQLEIKARHRGQSFSYPLFKVRPEDYDDTKIRLRATSSVYKRNKELNEIKENMYNSWDLYESGAYSWDEFTRRLRGGKSHADALQFVDDVFKPLHKDATYKAYYNSIKAFQKALGTSSVLLTDFNYTTIVNVVNKWKERLSPASINTYIKHIATVVNEAYRRGLTDSEFVHYKQYRQKESTRVVQTITTEQFDEAIDKVDSVYKFQALAFWILSFSMRGMYSRDLVEVHKHRQENYDRSDLDRYVFHRRSKTGEAMDVKYSLEPIEDIFNTLRKSLSITHSHLVSEGISLELLNYDSNDSRVHRNVWSNWQHRCKELLGAPLKSARKSFESVAMLLDVSQAIRYRLLGHTDRTIKKHYLNWEWDSLRDKVDKAHSEVLIEFKTVELWTRLKDKFLELTDSEDTLTIDTPS